jgi:hypothetical protein
MTDHQPRTITPTVSALADSSPPPRVTLAYHGTPVVGSGDRSESFLARCIPNLELDFLVIQLYGSDLEINAYGRTALPA